MVELPLSAGDIYDLVAGSTEIKLSDTITRREPNYFKGPPGLKRQIIIDLWAPYLALVRKCCCTGIKECQATVVAFENFLEIMKNQADFGPKFKNLCHSMPHGGPVLHPHFAKNGKKLTPFFVIRDNGIIFIFPNSNSL